MERYPIYDDRHGLGCYNFYYSNCIVECIMTTLSEAIALFDVELKLEISNTYQSVEEINHINGWVNGYVEAYNKAMRIIRQQQRMMKEAIRMLDEVPNQPHVSMCWKTEEELQKIQGILSPDTKLEET